MSSGEFEHFVSGEFVREDVLRKSLTAIFGRDARCQRARKGQTLGWLVSTSSKARNDWEDVLRTATREVEKKLAKSNESDSRGQSRKPDTPLQAENKNLTTRPDGYRDREDAQRPAPKYSRHDGNANGEQILVTPARKSSLPVRPLVPGRQGSGPGQVIVEQSEHPYNASFPREVRPQRFSSLPQANTYDRDRPQAATTRPLLTRSVTHDPNPQTHSNKPTFQRRPSAGYELPAESNLRSANLFDRHGKPIHPSEGHRTLVDRPDDDDDDDDQIGHRHSARSGLQAPIAGARRLGRDDVDTDPDDPDDPDNIIGHQKPTFSAKGGRRRRTGQDDDDEDENGNDGTVGHTGLPRFGATSQYKPLRSEKGRRAHSVSTASSFTSSQTTSGSSIFSRGSSIGTFSELGSSNGTSSERGSSLMGTSFSRDRVPQPTPLRQKRYPQPVIEDNDSELSYTDDTDEDPSTAKPMESSKGTSNKRHSDDVKKRSSQPGREIVEIARSTSHRERDPRYGNAYKR